MGAGRKRPQAVAPARLFFAVRGHAQLNGLTSATPDAPRSRRRSTMAPPKGLTATFSRGIGRCCG